MDVSSGSPIRLESEHGQLVIHHGYSRGYGLRMAARCMPTEEIDRFDVKAIEIVDMRLAIHTNKTTSVSTVLCQTPDKFAGMVDEVICHIKIIDQHAISAKMIKLYENSWYIVLSEDFKGKKLSVTAIVCSLEMRHSSVMVGNVCHCKWYRRPVAASLHKDVLIA
nr:hypothetical protein TetV2_00465 [Oceanusvirus sp.]